MKIICGGAAENVSDATVEDLLPRHPVLGHLLPPPEKPWRDFQVRDLGIRNVREIFQVQDAYKNRQSWCNDCGWSTLVFTCHRCGAMIWTYEIANAIHVDLDIYLDGCGFHTAQFNCEYTDKPGIFLVQAGFKWPAEAFFAKSAKETKEALAAEEDFGIFLTYEQALGLISGRLKWLDVLNVAEKTSLTDLIG